MHHLCTFIDAEQFESVETEIRDKIVLIAMPR